MMVIFCLYLMYSGKITFKNIQQKELVASNKNSPIFHKIPLCPSFSSIFEEYFLNKISLCRKLK